MLGSNQRPSACRADALPTELTVDMSDNMVIAGVTSENRTRITRATISGTNHCAMVTWCHRWDSNPRENLQIKSLLLYQLSYGGMDWLARPAGVEPASSAGQAEVMSRYTTVPGAACRNRTRNSSVRSRVLCPVEVMPQRLEYHPIGDALVVEPPDTDTECGFLIPVSCVLSLSPPSGKTLDTTRSSASPLSSSRLVDGWSARHLDDATMVPRV